MSSPIAGVVAERERVARAWCLKTLIEILPQPAVIADQDAA
jgi:hypothetical protein